MGGLFSSIKNIAGGVAQVMTAGAYNPNDGSIGTNNMANSGLGIGGYATMAGLDGGNLAGMMGGGPKGPGAGASADASAAYKAQVDAAMLQSQSAERIAMAQIAQGDRAMDASAQQAQMGAMGGIIAGAMASQQDNTVRKQMLPHESGAATILSHDLAQQWNKTLQMRTAGYQDAAINYEMSGRSWKAKWDDSQWNAMSQVKQIKQDTLQNVQLFGIKSDQNPNGIDMPEEEWMSMHAMKDPEEMMKVDPAEAAQRNEQYAAWKEKMYREGNDLVVQMYENPQLAGNNIMTMKGKDALIDERIAPLIKAMNQDKTKKLNGDMEAELAALDAKSPQFRSFENNTPGKGQYVGPDGQVMRDSKQNLAMGDVTAKDQYEFQMDQINKQKDVIRAKYAGQIEQMQSDKGIWDQAINAATKGEQNQYTDQIKKLQKAGVIDQYGQINAASLNQFIPPELMAPPKFSMTNDVTEDQKLALKDDYNKYASMKVDEKLIRNESLGGGVTRKILLNKDGTRAASAMSGQMMDKMGNSHTVTMAGDRAQDFANRAAQFQSFSPLSPGYHAGVSANTRGGKLEMRDDDNYMAKFSTGQKGNSAKKAAAAPVVTAAPAGPDPLKKAPKTPTAGNANPAASAGGAPLAAGG